MAKPSDQTEQKPKAKECGKDTPVDLDITVKTKKHEGTEQPYIATILIDGEKAFSVWASSFDRTGQMERFIRWIEENSPGNGND